MFEKTKSAEAKAKEHLDAAEILAERKLFAQAYAHLVLAMEESAVAGIRLLTESELLSWTNPAPWFKWKEIDLSRPGTHRKLLRLGLTIATVRTALATAAPNDLPNDPRIIFESVTREALGPAIESIPHIFADPVFNKFLLEGDRRKMAAFYSSPWKPSPLPTEADYEALLRFARPFILNLQKELPTADEMATVRPILQALLLIVLQQFESKKAGLREAIRRSFAGSPSS